MACVCSSAGAAELQVGLTGLKPSVASSRWIASADADSARVGISRYILQPGPGKHEMNVLVMGDFDRMAYVNLDRTGDVSSVRITMFSTGDQLDIDSSPNSIDVGWNSMSVLSVDDGEFIGAMGSILDSAAVDVMNALANDRNVRKLLLKNGAHPSVGSDCNTACREEWPRPDDCDGMWDEYKCCIIEAHYDHCRRICKCILNDNGGIIDGIKRRLCEDAANTGLIVESLACAAQFLWFLD